jgi:hypothetical protein
MIRCCDAFGGTSLSSGFTAWREAIRTRGQPSAGQRVPYPSLLDAAREALSWARVRPVPLEGEDPGIGARPHGFYTKGRDDGNGSRPIQGDMGRVGRSWMDRRTTRLPSKRTL